MSLLIPTRTIVDTSTDYPLGYHRGNVGGLVAVEPDLVEEHIMYGIIMFGILGTMVQWVYDLYGETGEPAVLSIPTPSIALAVVEDHSGGGFTADPNPVIPSPPLLSISELALFDQQYELGDDGDFSVEGLNWEAQTFTTLQAHNIEIIEIKCRRVLNPGDITIGIWATVADLPSGGDLTSVTFDGNALLSTDKWITRYVVAQGLAAATKYAIVVRAPAGDGANYLVLRKDGTVPTYAGGARCLSDNGGVGWSEDINTDFMFREGEVLV